MSLLPKRQIAVVLLAIGIGVPLRAAEHPVPLEKGVTDAKCLECHEDKTKGKVVHAAVGMGCSTCHLVRIVSAESTRITLKNARPATLCLQCHGDKKVAGNAIVHPMAQTDCLKCHSPHVSANEKLLLKPMSGGKDENLCLTCHTTGTANAKDGSRHAALDMGCGTCHNVHKTGDRAKSEFKYHLTKVAPAGCVECHDVKAENLTKAHQGQPFATANCSACHDPHESKAPKLMRAFLHQPFEGKACDTCHQAPKDGKVVLTQADAKSVCLTCHEEVGKNIDSAKMPHAGAQGDCTSCHNPHAGKNPKFIADRTATCTACHTNQAEAMEKKAVLHGPAFSQACYVCHAPHGNDKPHLLRAADAETLCLTCHAPDAKAKTVDGKDVIFNDVKLPAGYVANSPHIILSRNMLNHPVPAHPVTGQDPRNPSNKITCTSCHDPHAGQRKNMLLSSDGTVRAMCKECHKEQ